jgi:hypothetical protein
MSNRAPEQDLINQFMEHLEIHESDDLRVSKEINKNCKSRTYADIEFISASKLHWVIEAKSNDSKDCYNTVHKIFGELLKESGRDNRDNCRYAILIPSNAIQFYSQAFRSIHRSKFNGFGCLIPIDCIFTSDKEGISQIPWEQFYDAE